VQTNLIHDMRACTLELVNVKLCNLGTSLTCRLEIYCIRRKYSTFVLHSRSLTASLSASTGESFSSSLLVSLASLFCAGAVRDVVMFLKGAAFYSIIFKGLVNLVSQYSGKVRQSISLFFLKVRLELTLLTLYNNFYGCY
jgi:hypothetical protein